jgi:hypothetical protein
MPTTTKSRRYTFTTEAIMIRKLHAYREARDNAETAGTDVSAEPETPSFPDLSDRYDRLLDEMSSERPDTMSSAIAYLDLVADIILGQIAFSHEEQAPPVAAERDFGYALELLTSVRHWLNDQDIGKAIAEERAKDGSVFSALETLNRRGADAELFALIAECRRLEKEEDTSKGKSDEEINRLVAELGTIRAKIDKTRPVTLRGVLAVLDLGSGIPPGFSRADEGPDDWPANAIEGLREIVVRETSV